MHVHLKVDGLSQYDNSIKTSYHASACGPVTTLTILRYWMPNSCPYDTNQLYRLLGSTRIGLFTWLLKRNLRKILGPTWEVNTCTIEEAKSELLEGRPVACKFDRYFSFHWFGTHEFAYHWVPLIGFEENENGVKLTSSESFRGPLLWMSKLIFIPKRLHRLTQQLMQSIKTQAEACLEPGH